MSFEIGTKVKLKDEYFLSNTPSKMIVESVNDADLSVFWFGNDGSKKEEKFNKSFLEEISDEEYDPMDGAFFDDGVDSHGGSTTF